MRIIKLFMFIPISVTIALFMILVPDDPYLKRENYEKFILDKASLFSDKPSKHKDGLKAPDEPDMAAFQEYIKTFDPNLGYVPKKRLLSSYNYTYAIEQEQKNSRNYVPSLNWTGSGANMGGRTRAVMFDPNDTNHNKVWAGGVTGGLWYTNDITDANSQWVVVDDFWSNLAISSISYDPNSTNTFYVGTGEAETARVIYRESSGLGAGIFKTTDGGTTWNLLASTEDFEYITDIEIVNESGTSAIYACVASGTYEGPDHQSLPSDGVYRSTDGGATWTQVLPNISGKTVPYTPADIEVTTNGRIFIGTMENLDGDGGATVLFSDTGLSGSWTVYSNYNGLLSSSGLIPARTIVAVSPSDPNRVYAQFAGGHINGFTYYNGYYIAKSTDAGATWSSVNIPAIDWTTLAWHAFILQVDPVDPDRIFTGGLDLWNSSDAGTSWTKVSDWSLMYAGGGNDYVHADQHNIQYKTGTPGTAVFTCDGGVFLSNTSGQNTPIFIERNQGYNTLQYYSGAINPTAGSNNFLAGAQDNGTMLYTGTPVGITDMISGGDGAYCFWDENESEVYITSYQRSRYQVWNSGSRVYTDNIATGTFISPGDYDYDNNILYSNAVESFGTTKNILYRLSGIPLTNNREIISIGTTSNVPFSHIKYSPYSPSGTSTLFVGTESGKLYKVTGAESSASSTEIGDPNFPTSFLSCVAIGSSEDNILVTFSNYGVSSVWLTSDGGTTWEEKESNLPDMPIRWAIFHPDNNAQVMLATEIGVWTTNTLNDAVPEWAPAVTGLANVRVDMLKLRKSDNTVLAATHGRGIYTAEFELEGTVSLPYAESFDYGLGDCVSYSVTGNSKNWYWSSSNHFALMNGYNSGDVEEDWLILPPVNLDNYSNEIMLFHNYYNYGYSDNDNYLKLLYSVNYPGTGDPNSFTWNELSFTKPNSAQSWASSGVIDLSSISGTDIYIAFKYKYSPGMYRKWIVDNISIEEGTPIDVTFNVNMENETVSADGVHIAGEFNNWSSSSNQMFDNDGDGIYSTTLSLYANVQYQFKYLNGNSWGTEETVREECRYSGTTNRNEVTGSSNYSLDAVCFGSCTNCGIYSNYNITFRVNMQEETVTGDVYLAGDFNGWSNTLMINTSGDIWEVTIPLVESSQYLYKFKNGSTWENFSSSCTTGSTNNRFYTGPTKNTTLDLVCFNSCSACPPPDLIISEVADPKNFYDSRFIELYNIGTTTIDFDAVDFYITKQVNGDTRYSQKLVGSVAPGETFVLSAYSSAFSGYYSFEADQYSGIISGNGNDGYFLYFGGDYSTGVLIDAFGVIDENGIGKPWNYYQTKAVRLRSVTSPSSIWVESEWDIPTEAFPENMTPSAHNEDVSWQVNAINNNWNLKSTQNWSGVYGYIPDASFNVTIPTSNNYYPSVTGQSTCNSLIINTGAVITISADKSLTIYGD